MSVIRIPFTPRSYQIPILDAIENKGYKRVVSILPRRAGKDLTAYYLCVREALRSPKTIYYVFPTYAQGKKVLWDGITNDGTRIIDIAPKELVESRNVQEMKIRFRNGSVLQIVGSEKYDTLRGTNPQAMVFSEYASQDPRAYQTVRPILTANNGWALMISTPAGKNHLWDLYQIALTNPDWFCYLRTVEDTQHIPMEEIEKERSEGLMSDDLIQQEYFCSFSMGVEGSYYSKYLNKARLEGRIGTIPWDNSFQVHTAWDIGVRDATSIVFFQTKAGRVDIIDCYENTGEGIEHYVEILRSKPYAYGTHLAPHDIKVKEWGSGLTRFERARQLGIDYTMTSDVALLDGIEAVRATFNRIRIDENHCRKLLNALESYHREFDAKLNVYKSTPHHDWSSHYADSLRYACLGIPKISSGSSPEQLQQRYEEAMHGRGRYV